MPRPLTSADLPERFARFVEAERSGPARAPFWATFTAQLHALPDDVFERLPKDGASEHDHYLYGAARAGSGARIVASGEGA